MSAPRRRHKANSPFRKILGVIVCFLPLVSGFLVLLFTNIYSRYSAIGISGSLIDAVAVMFALFASLLFSELWMKHSKINELMVEQATALRALLRLTEPLGESTVKIHAAVNRYMQKIKEEELSDVKLRDKIDDEYRKDTFSGATVKELYSLAADTELFQHNLAVQTAFLAKLEDLRRSWFARKELKKSQLLPEKVVLLFIFGFFTQLAIAISHVDNYKAMRDSELIFSLAFAASISILLVTAHSSFSSHFISIEILDDVA
jgi:hypothetical protein